MIQYLKGKLRPIKRLLEYDIELRKYKGNGVIVVFQSIPYNFRKQRVQHLCEQLSQIGYLILIIDFDFNNKKTKLEKLNNNIFQLQLHSKTKNEIYDRAFNDNEINSFAKQIKRYLSKMRNPKITYMSIYPAWNDLIVKLRDEVGGKYIFDYVDDNTAFPNVKEHIFKSEKESLINADNVVAAAKVLLNHSKKYNKNITLIRNAANIEDFEEVTQMKPGKNTIGYYGAISKWFDIETIHYVATTKPDWKFILIGRQDTDVSKLGKLSNIRFIGEIRYEDLTHYLGKMEIAIIPFLKTDLTKTTNPVKMYEYLMAGKKILSFENEETLEVLGKDYVYTDKKDFIKKIEKMLKEDKKPRINKEENTWKARACNMKEVIERLHK